MEKRKIHEKCLFLILAVVSRVNEQQMICFKFELIIGVVNNRSCLS